MCRCCTRLGISASSHLIELLRGLDGTLQARPGRGAAVRHPPPLRWPSGVLLRLDILLDCLLSRNGHIRGSCLGVRYHIYTYNNTSTASDCIIRTLRAKSGASVSCHTQRVDCCYCEKFSMWYRYLRYITARMYIQRGKIQYGSSSTCTWAACHTTFSTPSRKYNHFYDTSYMMHMTYVPENKENGWETTVGGCGNMKFLTLLRALQHLKLYTPYSSLRTGTTMIYGTAVYSSTAVVSLMCLSEAAYYSVTIRQLQRKSFKQLGGKFIFCRWMYRGTTAVSVWRSGDRCDLRLNAVTLIQR